MNSGWNIKRIGDAAYVRRWRSYAFCASFVDSEGVSKYPSKSLSSESIVSINP